MNHAEASESHKAIFITTKYGTEFESTDQRFHITKQSLEEELGLVGHITLTKPAAVFSAASDGRTIIQMPPIETLGKTYYIPTINLTLLGATGMVIVTSTEDSTYVVIKGMYDQVSASSFSTITIITPLFHSI